MSERPENTSKSDPGRARDGLGVFLGRHGRPKLAPRAATVFIVPLPHDRDFTARGLCARESSQIGVFWSLKSSPQAVRTAVSRAEKANPTSKFDSDLKRLKKDRALSISLDLPDASYPLVIDVRISRGTINQSVYIRAPGDRKSNKARLNWLLRQMAPGL